MLVSSAEKRRYSRLPVSIKIEGHWWDIEKEEHVLSAWMTAVSEGGALLRCSEPIGANSVIKFVLRLKTMKKVEIKAVVRWWRRNGEVRDLGVEFAEPIKRIGAYVERQLAIMEERNR